MATELGLSPDDIQSETFARVFSGNDLLSGMDPFAMCYGGHQFGQWAGQLGDGRAINLGEVRTADGRHLTLQLKGAGPTPYSRFADGLAVLRSSLREFLCSEAMHHLGIPTTRALSLVTTGDQVTRDMFYDGNPEREPGAVVCRVSPSFVRFGNFEIFASRREHDTLQTFADFVLQTDFPHIHTSGVDGYCEMFEEICRDTAELMVHWMRVGFVHGVMNTDNMSIRSLTIDYGPYGWLEEFDPDWTPNTTDASGRRYCFANQPQIAHWNLVQLANALYPLVKDADRLRSSLELYGSHFASQWQAMMSSKLGLDRFIDDTDASLIEDLFDVLAVCHLDMTLFYRHLPAVFDITESTQLESEWSDAGEVWIEPLRDAMYEPESMQPDAKLQLANWLRRYRQRLDQDGQSDSERLQRMNAVNPLYVLRNYLAQTAIDQVMQGNLSYVAELLDVLRRPYTFQPGKEAFALKRPEWARNRPGCSMLSCSS